MSASVECSNVLLFGQEEVKNETSFVVFHGRVSIEHTIHRARYVPAFNGTLFIWIVRSHV